MVAELIEALARERGWREREREMMMMMMMMMTDDGRKRRSGYLADYLISAQAANKTAGRRGGKEKLGQDFNTHAIKMMKKLKTKTTVLCQQ